MSLIIIAETKDLDQWELAFAHYGPDLEYRIGLDGHSREEVRAALVWNHPYGVLNDFPNLQLIMAMGAGVDHLLNDPELPDIPIARIDPLSLARDMSRYCLAAILHYEVNFPHYRRVQQQRKWDPLPLSLSKPVIGILGLGNLGLDLAQKLIDLDYQVLGYSRSPKKIEGINAYHGKTGLQEILAQIDVLVCLLPLTPTTEGFLNTSLFTGMKKGAYLINVARGAHLVERDLLDALDSGQLSGACLDVFRVEPLPPSHPFWEYDQITITPHIASITDPWKVVPDIVENYHRIARGGPYLHLVDRSRGY